VREVVPRLHIVGFALRRVAQAAVGVERNKVALDRWCLQPRGYCFGKVRRETPAAGQPRAKIS